MKNLHHLVIPIILMVVISAFALHQIKHSTKQNIKIIQNIDEEIIAEKKEIQLLKVEFSHLSQPGRISKLKDALLPSIEPIRSEQILEWDQKK